MTDMLVTLFIPAYNRAYCIEKTLDAMLALDIPKGWEVEYLWSDDNSTDETFEIFQRYERTWKDKVRIILNRNEKNLRLGRHVEKIMTLGHGDWFVEFDSDDIPIKNRLLEIDSCLHQYPAMLGFSSGVTIQKKEHSSRYVGVFGKWLYACGATCAWHRSIFTQFSPLAFETGSQDIFIPFRVLLLGGQWVWSDTPTVFYGVDENNDSTPVGLNRAQRIKHLARLKHNWIEALHQRLTDLSEHPPCDTGLLNDLTMRHKRLIEQLEKQIINLHFWSDYLESSWLKKIRFLFSIPKEIKNQRCIYLRLILHLFPLVPAIVDIIKSVFQHKSSSNAPASGKTFAIGLDYLKDHPSEYLMML